MTEQLENAGYQTLEASNYQPAQDPSRLGIGRVSPPRPMSFSSSSPTPVSSPSPTTVWPEADVIMILGTGYEG